MSVNSLTQNLFAKCQVLKYIDLGEFAPNKTPHRTQLFDFNDASGVIISKAFVELVENIFYDIINSEYEGECRTPSKKRTRSSSSTLGSRERQVAQLSKTSRDFDDVASLHFVFFFTIIKCIDASIKVNFLINLTGVLTLKLYIFDIRT